VRIDIALVYFPPRDALAMEALADTVRLVSFLVQLWYGTFRILRARWPSLNINDRVFPGW